MPRLVADASALVSLGIVADDDSDALALCLSRYEVVVPTAVINEFREIASYDGVHGDAASAVLDHAESLELGENVVTVNALLRGCRFPLRPSRSLRSLLEVGGSTSKMLMEVVFSVVGN